MEAGDKCTIILIDFSFKKLYIVGKSCAVSNIMHCLHHLENYQSWAIKYGLNLFKLLYLKEMQVLLDNIDF